MASFQYRRRVAALFLYYCDVVSDLGRVNLSQIGFKPDPIVVCSDSQAAMRSKSSFREESSIGSSCSANSELT